MMRNRSGVTYRLATPDCKDRVDCLLVFLVHANCERGEILTSRAQNSNPAAGELAQRGVVFHSAIT
jgi:hypothetical protein